MYHNGKKMEKVFHLGKTMKAAYHMGALVWQAIRSCFGNGFWINDSPWSNDEAWSNGTEPASE